MLRSFKYDRRLLLSLMWPSTPYRPLAQRMGLRFHAFRAARDVLPVRNKVQFPWATANNHMFRRYLHGMTALDLLHVAVNSRKQATSIISRNATLEHAVEKIAALSNSTSLIVVDEDEKVVGMLTQHNILCRIAALEKAKASSSSTSSSDIGTTYYHWKHTKVRRTLSS